MSDRTLSRRELLESLAFGAAAMTVLPPPSRGAEPAKLDVNDPAAVALGYVENAAQVDAKKFPALSCRDRTATTACSCRARPATAYRPCSLFPGKLVAVGGWCSGWTAEM